MKAWLHTKCERYCVRRVHDMHHSRGMPVMWWFKLVSWLEFKLRRKPVK